MSLMLAKQGILDSLQRSFSDGPDMTGVLLFAVGAITLIALIAIAARYLNGDKPEESSPQIDYLTLFVDVLGLSEQDRRDLREVAKRADVEQPAVILMSPMNLALAAHAAAVTEGGAALFERMQAVSGKLFGNPLPALPHRGGSRKRARAADRG